MSTAQLFLALMGLPAFLSVAWADPFYLRTPAFPSTKLEMNINRALETPVLRTSGGSAWDSVDLLNPSVILWRGKYWNYYSGFDGKTWKTGVATSADGLAWQKLEQNPVLSPTSKTWDARYIAANGSAIVINDRVNYYYQGMTANSVTEIGLATSRDGYTLVRMPSPVVEPGATGAWDETGVGDPYVMEYHGAFYMFFLGMNRAGLQRIGIAKSPDGIHWSKHPGNPILDIGGAGDFDSKGLGEPSVINLGSVFVMFYTGRNDLEQRGIGIALSFDGINWRRQSASGLQLPRSTWSSEVLCDPTVMLSADGRQLRLWYGGGNKREPAEHLNGQVGYAELAVNEVAYSKFDAKSSPASRSAPSTDVLRGSYPIEEDGTCWIGREASIALKPPLNHGINIEGYVPISVHRKGNPAMKDMSIDFSINGQQEETLRADKDGSFATKINVPAASQGAIATLTIRVSDVFNAAQGGMGTDQRDLGIIINRITVAE